jgi:hypothetical protein
MTTDFFHPSLLLLLLDPGSGMGKNQDPGWVKIRIRDKHPGSTTLLTPIVARIPTLILNAYSFGKVPWFNCGNCPR